MIEFTNMNAAGFLPAFLSENSADDAVTQLNRNYAHGGGWQDFHGFTLHNKDKVGGSTLSYKGDPDMREISRGVLRDETVILYQCEWVAVVQKDGSYRVARMD